MWQLLLVDPQGNVVWSVSGTLARLCGAWPWLYAVLRKFEAEGRG
jgi:hypothetical protein